MRARRSLLVAHVVPAGGGVGSRAVLVAVVSCGVCLLFGCIPYWVCGSVVGCVNSVGRALMHQWVRKHLKSAAKKRSGRVQNLLRLPGCAAPAPEVLNLYHTRVIMSSLPHNMILGGGGLTR